MRGAGELRRAALRRRAPLDLRRPDRRRREPAPGFDDRAAATAVRFNGFYLFQCLDEGGTRRGADDP